MVTRDLFQIFTLTRLYGFSVFLNDACSDDGLNNKPELLTTSNY
jgi:hypothetical protein